MSLSIIISMSTFALAASISPGPVNLLCLSSGTQHSIYKGMIFVTGATLGFIALFIAIALGLYAALEMIPGLHTFLRWGGVIFLLYLSFKLAAFDGQLPEQNSEKAPGFMVGAIMQWLNPKAWLASASGIAAYTDGNDPQQVLIFAALYLPICWLSLVSWVYAGISLRRYVSNPAVLKAVNRTLAMLLATSCLLLIIE